MIEELACLGPSFFRHEFPSFETLLAAIHCARDQVQCAFAIAPVVRDQSLDAAEGNLVATLAAAVARVISIVPSGADLERVFLELTA